MQHVDGIAKDQPDVDPVGAHFVNRAEQLSQPAAIDVHSDHVDMGFGLRHRQRRRAAAGADLQHHRRVTAKPGTGIHRCPARGLR